MRYHGPKAGEWNCLDFPNQVITGDLGGTQQDVGYWPIQNGCNQLQRCIILRPEPVKSLITNQLFFINRGNDAPWLTTYPGSISNDFFLGPWEERRIRSHHCWVNLEVPPSQDDIRFQTIFHVL
jgi:hypothetical protein